MLLKPNWIIYPSLVTVATRTGKIMAITLELIEINRRPFFFKKATLVAAIVLLFHLNHENSFFLLTTPKIVISPQPGTRGSKTRSPVKVTGTESSARNCL
jgi:hypothetical protein